MKKNAKQRETTERATHRNSNKNIRRKRKNEKRNKNLCVSNVRKNEYG